MARRRGGSAGQLRWLGALVLAGLLAGGFGWWHLRHWRPDPAVYAVQGVEIGAEDGAVDWRAVKAIGADFAYLAASASAFARDPAFSRNLEEARTAMIRASRRKSRRRISSPWCRATPPCCRRRWRSKCWPTRVRCG
jgi:lysozyme